ncbi:copper chaperone PCu(A)C [Pseudomonas sp. Marseille-Q5115]|uniref:copper chaperone PCu(A)C n=1 Tax=Pseudomonas sp. Marseille-Q5115 TaxID=2866593 RepID=UPI001CE4A807|nr:copper chaperone PCu(A)C [Pseudomonas sp. Marseille-Q5115]
MPFLRRSLPCFFALALALFGNLAGAEDYRIGDLQVVAPWSQQLPPNAPTVAVYFVIRNTGMSDDRLTGVMSPLAAEAQLHEHIGADGMMKMQQVDGMIIPAAGQVRFAPMGNHVMLLGLGDRSQLADGGRFPLTLHFEKAGDVEVQVQVLADPPEGAGMHQHGG